MPAVVTDQEIQREIDTLRSLRRRSASSTGPGALPLDPDLPPPTNNLSTSPTSPSSSYPWLPNSPNAVTGLTRTPSRQYTLSYELGDTDIAAPSSPYSSYGLASPSSSTTSSNDPIIGTPHNLTSHATADQESLGGVIPPAPGDDPTHLFWVPAHLHPELAPGEFRAFLKQHTSDDPTAEGEAIDGGLNRTLSSGSAPGLARTPSWLARTQSIHAAREAGGIGGSAGGLGRKRSMLSKQYHPRAGDKVEEEAPPLPDLSRRGSVNRSSIYGGLYGEKGLTLQDLQKLEVMADQAAESDDPTKMRDLLRTSLTLNVSPDLLDKSSSSTRTTEDYDSPILMPPPSQIIRRNARTKLRKSGEEGARFGSGRGVRARHGLDRSPGEVVHDDDDQQANKSTDTHRFTLRDEPAPRRTSFDKSEESEEMYSAESGGGYTAEEKGKMVDGQQRTSRNSNAESDIYDAYERSADVSAEADTSVESSLSSTSLGAESEDRIHRTSISPSHSKEDVWDQKTPTSNSAEPSRSFIVGDRTDPARYVAPSPPSSPETLREQPMTGYGPPPSPNTAYNQLLPQAATASVPDLRIESSAPRDRMEALRAEVAEPPHRTLEKQQSMERLRKEKEKEKKGGFFSKKKDEVKKSGTGKKEKEKEGFLGSLFGSKKKHEEPAPLKFSSAGPAAAAALLGQSKSAKSIGLVPMSGGTTPTSPGFAPYARYPIHVERAVYRLSHIKLANPRRPLYEQVLISNLMFWYLSIINRSTNPSPTAPEEKEKPAPPSMPASPVEKRPGTPPTAPTIVPGFPSQAQQDAKKAGSLRSVASQGSIKSPSPPPINSGSPVGSIDQGKRTGLTKQPEPRNGPSQGRRAEIPVRPPQYGMQNLQIDQEYIRPGQPAGKPPTQPYPLQGGPQQPPTRPPQPSGVTAHLSPPSQPIRRQPSPPAPPPQQYQPQQQQIRPPSRGVEGSPSFRPQPVPPDGYRQQQQQQPARGSAPSPSMHPPHPDQMRRVVSEKPPVPMLGHPGHYPEQHMDRRVSEMAYPSRAPRPTNLPQHSGGIQPGQVFQYPGQSMNVQPGQVFTGALPVGQSPGQVFHHPQYSPTYPQSSTGQLPPGAMPPRVSQVAQNWNGQANGVPQPPRRSNSGDAYTAGGYDQQQQPPYRAQTRSFSGSEGPPYGQPYADPSAGSRSVSAQGPGRSGGQVYPHQQQQQQQQPPAPYNPYLRQQQGPPPMEQQRRGGSQDGHRSGSQDGHRGGSQDGHGDGGYGRRPPQQVGPGYSERR